MNLSFSTNSLVKVILISDKQDIECSTTSYDARFFASKLDIIRLDTDENIKKVLVENPEWDIIVSQNPNGWKEYKVLSSLSQWIRERWCHYNDYENHGNEIYHYIINQELELTSTVHPYFSVVTPLYKSRPEFLFAAYKSLCNQTFNNWEWIIIDDSPEPLIWVQDYFKMNPDPRVKYFRIGSTRGNIGLSKWRGCCMTMGRWIVEFDHDDMFLASAFETMKKAIEAYPDAGFIFSDNFNVDESNKVLDKMYGDEYAFGFAHPYYVDNLCVDESPNLNSATVRHIVGMPNHVRCWRRDIYFEVGGHNQNLRIADDYELCVKTFLKTRITRIKYPIYIQRYYDGNSQDADINRSDIQRRVAYIANHYNKAIHERMLELVGEDVGWEDGCSAQHITDTCYKLEDKMQVPYTNYVFVP